MKKNRNLFILSTLLFLGVCIAIIASSAESQFILSGYAYVAALLSVGFFVFSLCMFVREFESKRKNNEVSVS
jgi:hypothetical protein